MTSNCLLCRGDDRFFTQWHVWQHRSDSRRSSRVGFAPSSDCCRSLHQLSFHVCVRILSDSGERPTAYIYQLSAKSVFILTPSIFSPPPSLVSFSDARTIGHPGSFRSSSPVTQKWRKAKKKTVLLKLGLAKDMDGNLDQHFFYLEDLYKYLHFWKHGLLVP